MQQKRPNRQILELVREMCRAYTGEIDDAFRQFLFEAYESTKHDVNAGKASNLALSVPASGLLCYGKIDVIDDVLDSIPPPPQEAPEALIYRLGTYALRGLFPLPTSIEVRKNKDLVEQWFTENRHKFVWSEGEGKYLLEAETPNKIIRVRTNVAIIENQRILLVPEFYTDEPTKWVLPGGAVEFGETLKDAAVRETQEETGLLIECVERLEVYEVIEPDWHGVAVTFGGRVIGGTLKAEVHLTYGKKEPQWFTVAELQSIRYHPQPVINRVMGMMEYGTH